MQSLREIASVPKELSPESCGESRHGLAVVNIARRQPKGQQFALVVDAKMSCGAEAPPHGRLAPHTKWDCKYHVVFIPKDRRQASYKALRTHLVH